MKKVIRIAMFLAIAAMAYVNEVTAQVSFGATAGLNISNLSDGKAKYQGVSQDLDSGNPLAGFNLSGFVNFSFTRVIGLQPELAFSMQGNKLEDSGIKMTNRLNYINIPVLLDIKPVHGLSIFVGPQLGFNVYKAFKAENTTLSGSKYDDVLKTTNMKMNNVDIAAVVGVQYVIMDHFIVGTRANMGLQSIYDTDVSGVTISGYENFVFQISVGYKF